MQKCIICCEVFDPKTNKPEHILLDSLGGKKTTTLYLCTLCNETTGNTVDKSLADEIAPIRNLLNLKSGSGYDPPTLRGLVLPSGRKIDLLPGGVPDDKTVIYLRSPSDDGKIELQIGVHSLERLAGLIDTFAKGVQISSEQFINILADKGLQIEVQRIDEAMPFHFTFGRSEHQASIAKSCLIMWAILTNGIDIHGSEFEAVRRSVFTSTYQSENFDVSLVQTDGRPFEYLPDGAWGKVYNLLYVFSNNTGDVIGYFRLYNSINFYIKLGKSTQKQVGAYLISNPETGAWDYQQKMLSAAKLDWFLPTQKPDIKEHTRLVREAMEALLTYNYEKAQAEYREKIVLDAIAESLPNEGECIEVHHINKLSSEVAESVVSIIWGLNRTKTLEKDYIVKKLRELRGNLK